MLPRLLNMLSPKTWINQVASVLNKVPTLSGLRKSGSTGSRSGKTNKARREKAERVMALLAEAEDNGCREVWLIRAEMRMVRGADWHQTQYIC